jgi:PAS domain S-box-containing protein
MHDTSERALIVAPLGRDAALAAAILSEARIEAVPCENLPGLVMELQKGGGFALVAEEALRGADLSSVSTFLERQPEWSDFQFILLTFRGGGIERDPCAARFLDVLGNVIFLERPFHPTTLVSLAQAALRGRRRQYEARSRLIAIRESERRFRQVTESLPQFVWTCAPDGVCDYLSPQWYRYTGRSEGEQLGYGWLKQLHPADRKRVKSLWQATAAEGKNFEIEFKIRRHDGTYRWFRTMAVPLRDEAGNIVKWFGSNTDIDDIKQAEEKLRTSEERYRGIFQNAGTGIAILDTDGRFKSCNPAYEAMLGYTQKEFRALASPGLVHPEDREDYLVNIRRLLSEEVPTFEVLNRYVRKNGETLWVHKHVSLSRDAAGRPSNIVVLVTDMTAHKLHEEHTQFLLREINHRSKNMLNLVQAIAHLSASTSPEDFVRRFGERIRSLSAAQDLLVKHEWKAVPLDDLIRSQLAHFADLVGGRIALSGAPLPILPAASQPIGMALHELATNASKYGALSNETGRIAIAWDIKGNGSAEPEFTLCWKEQGGPPVATPQHRGFGSKVTTTFAKQGTGGQVTVEYAPSGLIWRLDCPANNIVEGGALAPVYDKSSVRPASGRRVLVVDDEPVIAAEIAAMLEEAGLEVIGPASGVREALSLLEHEGCDAAVLDVNLGNQTSEPIAQELIRRGTPFVLVSGYSRTQLPGFFRSAPFIHKPLQPAELQAGIKRCLVATGPLS